VEISNRLLFFKYALPCSKTLEERGSLSREKRLEMLELVKSGKEPQAGSENYFKVAMAHLDFIAMQKKLNRITDEVIREYFLFGHDEAVDERYGLMGDFDPESCRTYSGIVRSANGNIVQVYTPMGTREFNGDLVSGIKEGDIVSTHRGYVVEKIPKEIASRMWESKRKYFPDMKKNIFE